MATLYTYTDEDIKIIKEKYSYLTINQIREKYLPHISFDSLAWKIKTLRKQGINITPISRKRLYNYNEHFFQFPNVNNSYWAGFIAADGTIHRVKTKTNIDRYDNLKISLKRDDKHHLERFADDIQYNGIIKDGRCLKNDARFKNTEYLHSTLDISCNNICIDLNNVWNITPNKSLTLKPPSSLDDNCALSYIKGILDGDGYICWNNNRLSFGISGTFDILHWVKQRLSIINTIFLDKKIYKHKNSKMFSIVLNGKFAYEVLTVLKNINTPCLERKWNKIHEYEKYKGII